MSSSSQVSNDSPSPDLQWNDSHRLFVQSMICHRTLKESKALVIQEEVCALAQVRATDFAAFIGQINHRINDIDLALRRSHNQVNGEPIVVMVNAKQDEMAQMATSYDANQIAYLRRLIESIVMANDEAFAVRSLVAIPLGQQMTPPMTSKTTEDLLGTFVADGWIEERQGAYAMSSRTLLELSHYLHEEFHEVMKDCAICNEIITMGERCEEEECPVRLHRHCAEQFFVRNKRPLVCPTCQTPWSRSSTFGSPPTDW